MVEKEDHQNHTDIIIKDKAVLYAAYMPFLKEGGLFIPTKKNFEMGQELNLVITLPGETDKYTVIGKVAWITPIDAQGNRKGGIGVSFTGIEGEKLRNKIESLLAENLQSTRDTFTM